MPITVRCLPPDVWIKAILNASVIISAAKEITVSIKLVHNEVFDSVIDKQ